MPRLARPARNEGGFFHQLLVIAGVSVLSGVLMAGLALPWVGLVGKAAEGGAQAVQKFPLPLKFQPLNERTRVLASDGTKLAVFYDENRQYVALDKINDNMQDAIISIEDYRFYQHGAIDLRGTLRALAVNSTGSGAVQGGSTITQQLVKLTLQDQAKTPKQRAAATADSYARKFLELRYAVWVEQHYTKNQILEHYLNTAYFGDGAYGIQSAAHHYFSTSAADLTLTQAATLAGLVQNPTGYDPATNPGAAAARRDTVIARMLQLHVIGTATAHHAMHRPLGLRLSYTNNGCINTRAPFFCSYLLKYLQAQPALGETLDERNHMIYGGGLTIRSSVDLRFQHAADTSVRSHVYKNDHAIGALAMVQPHTGYVRALAQSRPMGSHTKRGQTYLNYTVPDAYGGSSGFQAGSTFKVFVLATAIENGVPLNKTIYSPSTITVNQGSYSICGGKHYPSNASYTVSNSTSSGTVDLYSGTQLSVNTFFIQLEQLTGLCKPWHLASQMGVNLQPKYSTMVPSFTLGIADVSPLEMADAYATFAARGEWCAATPIIQIRDRYGHVLPVGGPHCKRLLKPAYADAVNDILRGVQEGTGFGASAGIALNQPSAGKTGTTSGNKAVWFIGYTPTLATASMVAGANKLGTPITLNGQDIGGVVIDTAHGSTTAGPIWGDAMKAIQKFLPNRDFVAPSKTVVDGQSVTIPSLYGYNPSQAAKRLAKLGFKPQISYTVNSTASQGTVAYTSPTYQGTTGQTVYIYISNGYTPTPTQPSTQAPTYIPSVPTTPTLPPVFPQPTQSSPPTQPFPTPQFTPSPGPGNGNGLGTINGHGHGPGRGHGHKP